MSLQKNNLIIGAFILMAFVGVGVFGLLSFSHASPGTEAPMMNCPYTESGSAMCENTFDHIAGWQQFSNIITPALFTLLLLAVVLYFLNRHEFLNQEHAFYVWKYSLYDKKLHSLQVNIIKWLALFINSPSLIYVRHS